MSRKGLSDVSLKVLAHIICQKSGVEFYTADIPEMGGNRGAIMAALSKREMITKVGNEKPRRFRLTPYGVKYGNRYADHYISNLKQVNE